MQSDRELLELAAKAGGYHVDQRASFATWRDSRRLALLNPQGGHTLWNADEDNGDALRLAVKLAIDVLQRFVGGRRTEALAPGGPVIAEWHEAHGGDADAATRRAITRAAAQLAQAAQEGA